MKSSQAIRDFMEFHNIESDSFGNLNFAALVEYRSPARNASEITNIKIIRNGYQDGQIKLGETGDLKAEEYHLDFTTQYQKYSFSEANGKIVVSGQSPKMGGKYTVDILPE